jgi:hypothetical protein
MCAILLFARLQHIQGLMNGTAHTRLTLCGKRWRDKSVGRDKVLDESDVTVKGKGRNFDASQCQGVLYQGFLKGA